MRSPIWGIDLGGTKIEGVILPSVRDAHPIIRQRIDTEGEKGYHHVLGQVKKLVDDMRRQTGLAPAAIGFGTPGILDPVLQTMKNCNSTSLNGKALHTDLEHMLGVPVRLANDANCFALAETHWGSGKQYPSARMVFGIIMGTGVGGGIVFEGKIWGGKHGIAGEWGHNFLDASGGPCYCGKTGCVVTVLSGPALEKFYARISGRQKNLREIVALAGAGLDTEAQRTMVRLHDFFGLAVSTVVNMLDPDLVIVGGGVGNIESIYKQGVRALGQQVFNNRLDVPVVRPLLGDSAGVFGAAALVSGN
jgi:predicted NBD/HSP70 family sugar kinase